LRESKEGSAARVVHAREITKGKWSGQHPGGVPRLPTASSETRTLQGRKYLCINALPYPHLRRLARGSSSIVSTGFARPLRKPIRILSSLGQAPWYFAISKALKF